MRSISATLLMTVTLCASAQPGMPARDCVIVFGQGRNFVDGDAAANRLWDEVNLSFNSHVAARLEASGMHALPMVAHVSATDLETTAQHVLGRAASEGCQGVVETSLFADYANRALVARVRLLPVQAGGSAADGTPLLRIGSARYASERNFDLTQSALDRVRPGVLAAEMASELIEQTRTARPPSLPP
jgi:hypothetical protein